MDIHEIRWQVINHTTAHEKKFYFTSTSLNISNEQDRERKANRKIHLFCNAITSKSFVNHGRDLVGSLRILENNAKVSM